MAELFGCAFCDETFTTVAALAQHHSIQHMGRPWVPRCEICGETFESPTDLKAHHEGVHRSGHS
jgi:hypothetical protein